MTNIKRSNSVNRLDELVLSRTNLSSVVLIKHGNDYNKDTYIILIKEYRATCCNEETFVYELPGESPTDINALKVAIKKN